MTLPRLMALSGALLFSAVLPAGTLSFPSPTSVAGTDVFGGPSFVVSSSLTATDTISLEAIGTACLQGPSAYCTNAAGVIVTPGTNPTGDYLLYNGHTFGALMLGNSSLGFAQLFATNAGNGAGSAAPPTTLTLSNVTLGSLGFSSGISAGTTLQFRVWDVNSSDNGGGFQVVNLSTQSSVPEPGTTFLFALGIGGLGLWRRFARG